MSMKALVYKGPGVITLEDVPMPKIVKPTDAIVKVTKTTICGTDLHILKGDVPACKPGTILGHEGVGIVEEVGGAITNFKKGDRVIISCNTCCGKCLFCKKSMYSHCTTGGWHLGHTIDGTQAEYVKIPYADNSLHFLPPGIKDEAFVLLSDIFPTGYEIGVLNGKVQPGKTVAIIGAGPVGLAALMTAQFFAPSEIIVVDIDDNRLEVAMKLGATKTINPTKQNLKEEINKITSNCGVDVAIEAVGIPITFNQCEDVISPGGVIANVGVHGKPVVFHLERLWIDNITVTTGLVDTWSIPMLVNTVKSSKLDPLKLITHVFKFTEMQKAYDTFGNAASTKALKVIIEF